jgi:hypothetical protein
MYLLLTYLKGKLQKYFLHATNMKKKGLFSVNKNLILKKSLFRTLEPNVSL